MKRCLDGTDKPKKPDNKRKIVSTSQDDTPKRRLAEFKCHYLENPYNIDIKWEYVRLVNV